jgi:hypothetical protein
MRPGVKFLVSVSALLLSTGLWAQEMYHRPDAQLFARLSYYTSAVMEGDDLRHICLAISDDGSYRVERSLITGTERREGKLTGDQFEQIKKLLGSSEFLGLSGNDSQLIREGSEKFAAEIPPAQASHHDGNQSFGNEPRRMQWLNADGASPFPASMQKVVDWLKGFDPKDGREFEYADYPDVCPSSGLRLVQPPIAANRNR